MNKLLSKSFLWMFIGLMTTFITGYIVSISENMLQNIFGGPLYVILIILELGLAIFFTARLHKMDSKQAKIYFLLYSFVSGLTFSMIFVGFKLGSVVMVFLIAALVFGIFGAIGYFTEIDLGKFNTILIMGLSAIVLCFIINLFLKNDTFDLIVSMISVIIFFGFTAYDVQKIKREAEMELDTDVVAIHGAFELYLDFINIFLDLLRLMGDAKD